MRSSTVFLALATATLPAALAIVAPDTSLATVPCAYFGGNYARRGDANIAMLAKMRLVMLEKWEGHCWQDCLGNGTGSLPCHASCGVEDFIVDTHRRVKALNPAVSSVLYWNTLLAFPFYRAVGQFADAGALTVDSDTGVPISIRNDNGMEAIGVFGFDTAAGVTLYVDTVKNLTATGAVDGFFGDKWGSGAKQNKTGGWQICNHECGSVTAAQAAAWNAGKAEALAAATAYVGAGPYFANGDFFGGVESNLNGHWAKDKNLESGDPRIGIKDVTDHLVNHTYFYQSCTGDQKWTTDPNAPASLLSACSEQVLARFLLSVEKGCFLGTNGWDAAYERPLGDPLAPAVYAPAQGGSPATLNRSFASGTYVTFVYNAKGTDGKGEIFWSGPPPPTPAPTPAPPTPAPPTIDCGGTSSTLLKDTTFGGDDVAPKSTLKTAEECCAACVADTKCLLWAFHGSGSSDCHLHGATSDQKNQKGTTSGRIDGRL